MLYILALQKTYKTASLTKSQMVTDHPAPHEAGGWCEAGLCQDLSKVATYLPHLWALAMDLTEICFWKRSPSKSKT